MKPIVIFGLEEQAEVAHFYFEHDADRRVAAFTADRAYIKQDSWKDLPVIPYEIIEQHYPPEHYDLFVAIGYSQVNKVRRDKCLASKKKGYKLPSYISSKATCWTKDIGDNCFILEDNTLQPFARIGNNVVLWSGNHIGHHSVIADHCFITSHAVISGKTHIGEGTFIGVNATLRDNIRIGSYCVIGAGALIMQDTGDNEIYPMPTTQAADFTSDKLKKL